MLLEYLGHWGCGFATSTDNSNVLKPGAVHPLSPAFQKNQTAMALLLEQLHQLIAKAVRGGGEKAIKRHCERGKLLPRERIDAILDPGSPFLELSQLAGHNMYGSEPQRVYGVASPLPWSNSAEVARLQHTLSNSLYS